MHANKLQLKLDFSLTLADNILMRGGESPGKTYMLQGDEKYTRGDLFQRINAVKRFLSTAGVKRGDRVGLLSANSLDYIAAHFACMSSGFVLVPIDIEVSRLSLDFMISNTQTKILLASGRVHSKFKDIKIIHPLNGIIQKNLQEADTGYAPSGIKPNELAMLLHTSGTTGEPVAVQITHLNLVANTNSILDYLELGKEDRLMLVLPFFHCYGMSLLHMMSAVGGEMVINNSFMFPQRVADELVEKKCTVFAGVPATYKILMKMTRIAEMDTRSLGQAYCCAGKLSEKDLMHLQKAMPHSKIILFYGQTEASPRLSYLPYEFYNSKLGSIGKGIPGVELRVVDESEKDVKPSEVGEIIARGDNISPGYWNDEEKTKETFRNGWLYTGDLARVDSDGFIYIVGRRKDFVKVAGKRFSLTDIEDVANSMPGISEAAALMVPDDVTGEAVRLFAVPESNGVTEDSVLLFCKQNLPPFKVPRDVTLVKEIPKNTFGKVQKRKLLEIGAKLDA